MLAPFPLACWRIWRFNAAGVVGGDPHRRQVAHGSSAPAGDGAVERPLAGGAGRGGHKARVLCAEALRSASIQQKETRGSYSTVWPCVSPFLHRASPVAMLCTHFTRHGGERFTSPLTLPSASPPRRRSLSSFPGGGAAHLRGAGDPSGLAASARPHAISQPQGGVGARDEQRRDPGRRGRGR